jgi:NAD(P)H-quinone oxidoreductase subunit 6|tara:strand:- start:1871 stop:2443 length:573 start_codon:yes stop_codon:yes gene_type:complete
MSSLENIQELFFSIFAFVSLVGSLGVILLPNLVYAAFFLGITLVSIAGFYLLLNADFLAAAQILLYVGGINILILFAIMLVDANARVTRVNTNDQSFFWVIQGGAAIGLFFLLTKTIQSTLWPSPPFIPVTNTVYFIGRHIFSDFLFPFELVSVLLLIALIGVVVLAKREQNITGPLNPAQENDPSFLKR